jgi:hypothetical protein
MHVGKLRSRRGDPFFLPSGKICRLRHAKQVSVIASREYGLY